MRPLRPGDKHMYNWRKMTPAQRADVLRLRQISKQPWHRPPHGLETNWFHLAASCYEHAMLLGSTPQRLSSFSNDLDAFLRAEALVTMAWCILPNHYHALVQCIDVTRLRKALGQLHGRTSHTWNVEDNAAGRKCWHACLLKPVRSVDHRWATLNYIHHNAVRHGYAARWTDWPFSSAAPYLDRVGRDYAERTWKKYPVLEMGHGWDEPDL